MEQLDRPLYRVALWALVLAIVGSTLFTFTGTVAAATPNYTLSGFVYQPAGFGGPVPSGVQVDLVSQATGVVYTANVGSGGQFTFTNAGTGSALSPGYWGLWVPTQTNVTFSGSSTTQYAILSENQNPSYQYLNSSQLSPSGSFRWVVSNVLALPYNSTLKGTVSSQGFPEGGAVVKLLAPTYNGVTLVTNTTPANGTFTLKAPFGSWVLQTSFTQGPALVNTTAITISSRSPPAVNISLQSYLVTGNSYLASTPSSPVPDGGNFTLFDTASHSIFSTSTPAGGYYAMGTYPGSFDAVVSTVGYQTTWFPLTVTTPSRILHNSLVSAVPFSGLGNYTTTLNYGGLNILNGTGNLTVATNVVLGNNSVFPYLPNGSVGQMWAQLGLDFNHTLSFPASDLPALQTWVASLGPFLPAVQAGAVVNSTGFLAPKTTPALLNWASSCSGFCGLSSASTISYGWNSTYALNGTIAKNSSTYTIGFNFQHPTSANSYNYTVELPAGFILAADTQAPSHTKLVAAGPGGTWTKFTLVSQPSPSAGGTAKFTIVKAANLVANVNVSVSNFAFSSANILNGTHENYTFVVGVGQNVTFSALNSTYPAGTNGTLFQWAFGDGGTNSTTKATTNHTYLAATAPGTQYHGSLVVTSSGGLVNSTTFNVSVVSSVPTAGIVSNASANQTRTVAGTTYLQVTWGTVLRFNATGSSVAAPNVLSIAAFQNQGRGFKLAGANYSSALGGNYWQNYTFQFLGNGAYLTSGVIAGNHVAFLGWQYNLTLTVWTGTGVSAKTSLVVLVNDTQKPTPAFTLLNAANQVIGSSGSSSGKGVVEGSNGTAKLQFNAANSSDPNNGSVVKYYWLVTAPNGTYHQGINATKVKPNSTYPALWLTPLVNGKYTVNLTVWDRANNMAYTTSSVAVSVNNTIRPIMSAANLTGATSLTAGSSYTFWVNITNSGGSLSTASGVSVTWYTTGPSGTGSRATFGGSPGSVQFYNYTAPGVVNTVPFATGVIQNLSFNKTVRAQVTWSPSSSGNYILWANATATNEWTGVANSTSPPGTISQSISVKPNPTTQTLEYAAIIVVIVAVILVLIWWYRRPARKAGGRSTGGKSGLERSSKKAADDDEDDDS